MKQSKKEVNMSEKQLKEDFKNKRIDFILTQFESLSGHIDTLISSGTMRIYSFLFLYTIGASVVSIIIGRIKGPLLKYSIVIGCIAMILIGWYMALRQVQSSVKIIGYYGIMNEIRGKLVGDDKELVDLFVPSLPLSKSKGPKSIWKIFEPGIFLIEALNSLTIFALVWILSDNISCSIILAVAFFFIQLLFFKNIGERSQGI